MSGAGIAQRNRIVTLWLKSSHICFCSVLSLRPTSPEVSLSCPSARLFLGHWWMVRVWMDLGPQVMISPKQGTERHLLNWTCETVHLLPDITRARGSLGTEQVRGGAGSTWVLPRENPRPDVADSALHLLQQEWRLPSPTLPTPLHRGPHSKPRKLSECLADLPVQQGLQDVLTEWVWGKSVTDSSQVSGLISWVHGDAVYRDVPNRRECRLGAGVPAFTCTGFLWLL